MLALANVGVTVKQRTTVAFECILAWRLLHEMGRVPSKVLLARLTNTTCNQQPSLSDNSNNNDWGVHKANLDSLTSAKSIVLNSNPQVGWRPLQCAKSTLFWAHKHGHTSMCMQAIKLSHPIISGLHCATFKIHCYLIGLQGKVHCPRLTLRSALHPLGKVPTSRFSLKLKYDNCIGTNIQTVSHLRFTQNA